jgi:fructose-bisphosphate aldolase class II
LLGTSLSISHFKLIPRFRPKALTPGINIVHINTELRVAWRHGLEDGLAKQPNEVAPYKILPLAVESVK